ncbi:MAG: DUF932 domain-containing protein [Bacteroidales bacterium]|nr:DUF932 domain-containing protein [Bacteroidales bacterium]
MNENRILDLSTRTPTWENLGTDVSKSRSIDDVIAHAGLDYEVTKMPLTVAGTDIIVPEKMVTVNSQTLQPFGVVSSRYQIIQNKEAFDFVNYINGDLEFVKAGQTATGMVYIIARLPEQYIMGDGFRPYVILRNSHNGRYPIQAAICPLRIVCQNQFTMAFRQSDNTVTIRHSRNAEVKMREAQMVLRQTADHMHTLSNMAEQYAVERITDVQLSSILEQFIPINNEEMSARQITAAETDRMSFMTAYNADDNANFKGTKWGLVNAFADYATHKPSLRTTATGNESRFMSVSFDPAMMYQFMQIVNAAA